MNARAVRGARRASPGEHTAVHKFIDDGFAEQVRRQEALGQDEVVVLLLIEASAQFRFDFLTYFPRAPDRGSVPARS